MKRSASNHVHHTDKLLSIGMSSVTSTFTNLASAQRRKSERIKGNFFDTVGKSILFATVFVSRVDLESLTFRRKVWNFMNAGIIEGS